nr:trifunctional udp-glucose 4,6-dehydratase/udp-4-keto-6-deoxy-d-glucose 3,5-epimerase/udp-4-keto-l-rhamnose-reductase rhm1 [Quercus suber]
MLSYAAPRSSIISTAVRIKLVTKSCTYQARMANGSDSPRGEFRTEPGLDAKRWSLPLTSLVVSSNCAGTRGAPNVDWCEDHKIETIGSNLLGTLSIVDTCYQMGIHITQFGSACIYTLS